MGAGSFSEVEDWEEIAKNEQCFVMKYYRAKPFVDSKNILELLETIASKRGKVFISWNSPLWCRTKSSQQIYSHNLRAFSPIP